MKDFFKKYWLLFPAVLFLVYLIFSDGQKGNTSVITPVLSSSITLDLNQDTTITLIPGEVIVFQYGGCRQLLAADVDGKDNWNDLLYSVHNDTNGQQVSISSDTETTRTFRLECYQGRGCDPCKK